MHTYSQVQLLEKIQAAHEADTMLSTLYTIH